VIPEEAVKAATLIGQLWPANNLDGTRKAFYATALTAIPTFDMAVKAINELFITEPFQPTPGQIIDKALALDELAAVEWQRITQAATELQSRRPTSVTVDHRASAIVQRMCGGIGQLPVSDWRQMDRLRTKFIADYTNLQRSEHTKEPQHELGP